VSTAPSVLLVGLGRWGEKHLRVLRELGTDLWLADVTDTRRAWAERQGVRAERIVSDYRDALPHVGAVDVVTPADSHRAIADAAMTAGRHCFVEKPLAGTLTDARHLRDVAAAQKVVLQLGKDYSVRPVKALVDDLEQVLGSGAVQLIGDGLRRQRRLEQQKLFKEEAVVDNGSAAASTDETVAAGLDVEENVD